MPFYGGGRAAGDVYEYLGEQVVLEETGDGKLRVWADDGYGYAPELTPAQAVDIGNTLAGWGAAHAND